MQGRTAALVSISLVQRGACLAIVALMHGMFLWAVVATDAGIDERPTRQTVKAGALALRVVFVEAGPANKRSPIVGLLSPTLEAMTATHIETTAPDITPLLADSFEPSRELMTADDAIEAQRLQKVYVGQISARLRRVLEDFRATSPAPEACLVNVVQDDRGTVLDVLMDQCQGDVAWLDTVSRVIRQASPLPLPPQGLAMGSYLTLDVSNVLSSSPEQR
jgi:hypothetical protein